MSLGFQSSPHLQCQLQNPNHISSLTNMGNPELLLSPVHTCLPGEVLGAQVDSQTRR